MSQKLKRYFTLAVGFITLIGYQNCGKQSFSSVPKISDINKLDAMLCSSGNNDGIAQQLYHPNECLYPRPYVSENSVGIELNKFQKGQLRLKANAVTQQNKRVYVEIATYIKADTIVIRAELANGNIVTILNVCNVQSYPTVDNFTGGVKRPYSTSILPFDITIPAGTQYLEIDTNSAGSFNYISILNLNEFTDAINELENKKAELLAGLSAARQNCAAERDDCEYALYGSHFEIGFVGKGANNGSRDSILLTDIAATHGRPLDSTESLDGYNNTKESGYFDPLGNQNLVCR